jgi:putative serine protease PepD
LAPPGSLRVGDPVYAIGNPYGFARSLTSGLVSALGRQVTTPDGHRISELQTDAPLNPGNSGGPLLDARGRVVGVTSQIYSVVGANTGIGFAIPVATVRAVLPDLD